MAPRRPRRHRAPRAIKPLKRHARAANQTLREQFLLPLQQRLVEQLRRADTLEQALAVVREPPPGQPSLDRDTIRFIQNYQQTLDQYHRAQTLTTFKAALGVDVRPFLIQKTADDYTARRTQIHVDLIRTLPGRLRADIRTGLRKAFGEQWRSAESAPPANQLRAQDPPLSPKQVTAQVVTKAVKKSDSNLQRIVNDQTGKTIGGLTRLRHKQMHVEKFRWKSVLDKHGRPSHAAKNGLVFPWNAPPPDTGIPGSAVNCRCVAEPVIDDETLDHLYGLPLDPAAPPPIVDDVIGVGDDAVDVLGLPAPIVDDVAPAFQADPGFLSKARKQQLEELWTEGGGAPVGALDVATLDKVARGIDDYAAAGYRHINKEMRDIAQGRQTGPMSVRTQRALDDFEDHMIDIEPGTVTFRGRRDLVDWNVGDVYTAEAFESSSAAGDIGSFFGTTRDDEIGTMIEMRWRGQNRAVVINSSELEYVAMPNTSMKVLARYDDVQLSEQDLARRYYVVELDDMQPPQALVDQAVAPPRFQTEPDFMSHQKSGWPAGKRPVGALDWDTMPEGVETYIGHNYEAVNKELRDHARGRRRTLSAQTRQVLDEMEATRTDVAPGTVTFRGRTDTVDLSVGDAYTAEALESSSASGRVAYDFGIGIDGLAGDDAGTIIELRWPGRHKATIVDAGEFEYISMPDTQMRVLARFDDVDVLHVDFLDKTAKANRYYIMEVMED